MARRAQFPPAMPEVATDSEEHIPPLVFTLRFPRDPDFNVDLSAESCPRLIRHLAAALRQMAQVGGRVATRATAYTYVGGIRKLATFLGAQVHDAGQMTLDAFTPQLLDTFESQLYATMAVPRTAYGQLAVVVAMLRHLRNTTPHLLHPDMPARLRFLGRHPYPHPVQKADAYAPETAAQLRAACREHLRGTVRRITVDGEEVLAAGVDPRHGGWTSEANLLWEIDRRGTVHEPDVLIGLGLTKRPPEGFRLRELHHLVYPTEVDLAAIAILLILDTGLEPEAVRGLRADCLRNPSAGHVEIDYLKRRRHGEEHGRLRVRDGNSATPGGLIRLALRLTRRARGHLGDSASLWVCVQNDVLRLGPSRLGTHPTSGATALVARYGLTDVDGDPLNVNLRRLRKTYKAEFYRATGGQLPLLARGHSSEVAADRYADIPALRGLHETAITAGLTEALAEVVQLRVLTATDEHQIATHPERAAEVAGVNSEQVQPLLSGEMDMWLSACRDFTDSPFGTKGQPCPVPFWNCLDCTNAIVTSRKLPAVLSFLDHLAAQREEMPAHSWAALHGPTWKRILTQILPAFPTDVVETAKAIAEAEAPLRHLPPQVGGIGARA